MSRKGSTMDNEEGLREAFATFDKASICFQKSKAILKMKFLK